MNSTTRFVITALLLTLLAIAGCTALGGGEVSPVPTPPRERTVDAFQGLDLGVDLITGTVASEYRAVVPMASVVSAGSDAECDINPIITDTRPEGHNSLSVLPRLGPGDFDAAQAFYGFQILDHHGCRAAEPGDWYWDIGELFFECGANNLHPVVHDEYGDRITDRGILLFLSWSGAPELGAVADPPYAFEKWHSQIAVGGFTRTGSGGGDLAWAYGPESHIGPDGGPYLIWASSDPPEWGTKLDWSDGFDKAGWWDDHCEFSPYFYLTQKEGGAVPTGLYHLLNIDPDGNIIGIIPFQEGVSPSGTWRLGLRNPDGVDLGYTIWTQEE